MSEFEDEGSNDKLESRKMFKATCSDCGQECEVPFEPTEGKPVRCNDCFRKSRPRRNNFRRNNNFRGGGFNRGPRQMFKATCSDCGKECEVPFKPREGAPVRCNDCFRKSKEEQ